MELRQGRPGHHPVPSLGPALSRVLLGISMGFSADTGAMPTPFFLEE